MVKGEFIKALGEKIGGFTVKEATAAYDAFVEVLTEALQRKEKVSLLGFGTFELRHKAAKIGINPKTKEQVKIAESWAPAFKASKSYKASFN